MAALCVRQMGAHTHILRVSLSFRMPNYDVDIRLVAENVGRELERTYLRVNMHGLTAERESMATDFDGILDSMSSIIDDRMDRESDSEPGKD